MKTEEETDLTEAELDAAEGRSSVLNALVNEARTELAPPSRDWSAVEARLLREVPAKKRSFPRVAVMVLAAAAAVALYVRQRPEAPVAVVVPPAAPVVHVASAFRGVEGVGEVAINGIPVKSAGRELHADDAITADHARGLFERPGKVSWLVEAEDGAAHARVASAGDTLILGLDDGAIEAQVTPVPVGEAFAVDIAPAGHDKVRVAVHGTHLRVTRTGDHVVVDLSEGVVAIGVPPAEGITTGTEVRAPAHIELDATDLRTLKVERTGIRQPVPLAGHTPKLEAPAIAAASSAPPTTHEAPHALAPKPVKPSVPAREAIARAVRDCAVGHERAAEVKVTVTSDLRLQVDANGTVTSAQFTPPLLPEIQTCAAGAIYRTKVDETGTVEIPIEFSY